MKYVKAHNVVTFAPVALLLVVSLSGCVEPSNTAQPDDVSSISSPLAVGKIVPDTPEKAVQAYQRVLGNQDWEGSWALLHGRTRQAYRERASEFVKTFEGTHDEPDLRALERRLVDMGLTLNEVRRMTGKMLMAGLLRSQLKNDPEGFRAFVEAECIDHQQMGRQAVVSVRVQGLLQPRQVMTRRFGARWYIYEEPPGFP